MYYHSGGVASADMIYFILLIPVMILSLWAQIQVSGNFKKYSGEYCANGLTGREAAEAVLRANGVSGVAIRQCAGSLTDHYDPRDNSIYLSESVYNSATVAAVGVACHEAGHAVQYAKDYQPIRVRNVIIPATQFGSKASFLFLILGIILYIQPLLLLGIILFSFTTFFQLVTLPVEFDASGRAIRTIESAGLLNNTEIVGAKRVLRAAALTYVAALLMSALQLLRYVLIFMSRSNRGRR